MTGEPVRRRVWVQNVAVSAALLQTRLDAILARSGDDPPVRAVADGVQHLLAQARSAANRENPMPTRWTNWWRGTLIEASYQYLHAAEAQIATLYDDDEAEAEVAEAVARVDAGLHRDDPRRAAAHALAGMEPGPAKRALLRKVIEVGYAGTDRQHSRVRSFRNVILVVAALITLFMTTFVAVVAANPSWVPLCFRNGATAQVVPEAIAVSCPTGVAAGGVSAAASSSDVVVVVLLGLLGGAVAAAVSIKNMRGTSTPYDVPVALAALKVPLGALTAVVALIAIRGDFVPGLSALDSQEQILAYAVAFGFAQQALTARIDSRAQDLLNGLPSKDAQTARAPAADLVPAWSPPGAFAPSTPGP